MELDLRFDNITVDPIETSYWCWVMELPQEDDYHLFSMQPIIDNINVVHHIELFECLDHECKCFEHSVAIHMDLLRKVTCQRDENVHDKIRHDKNVMELPEINVNDIFITRGQHCVSIWPWCLVSKATSLRPAST